MRTSYKQEKGKSCFLTHTYALKQVGNAFYCACGEKTYPSSIWSPIIKVTLYKNTAGSYTWEYHSECVRKLLQGENIACEICTERQTSLCFEKLKKPRYCIVTKESLPSGTIVVKMSHGDKSVVTTKQRLQNLLSLKPDPISCSIENVIVDWTLNHHDWAINTIKAKCETGISSGQKFDRVAVTVLNFIETIETIKKKIQNEISLESVCLCCKKETTKKHSWKVRLSFQRTLRKLMIEKSTVITVGDFLYSWYYGAIGLVWKDFITLEPKSQASFLDVVESEYWLKISNKTLRKEAFRRLKLLESHDFSFFDRQAFDQLFEGSFLFNLLDIPLMDSSKENYTEVFYTEKFDDFFPFFLSLDGREKVEEGRIVEALVSSSSLLRNFAKALHQKFFE